MSRFWDGKNSTKTGMKIESFSQLDKMDDTTKSKNKSVDLAV
jgi:hypothetical protein